MKIRPPLPTAKAKSERTACYIALNLNNKNQKNRKQKNNLKQQKHLNKERNKGKGKIKSKT